jgi:hypothetical protein
MTRPLPQINADIKSESARAINQINKSITVISCLVFALGIWALNQADTHYEAQAKINQEQIAWNR